MKQKSVWIIVERDQLNYNDNNHNNQSKESIRNLQRINDRGFEQIEGIPLHMAVQ
jgi:hypothetical protein